MKKLLRRVILWALEADYDEVVDFDEDWDWDEAEVLKPGTGNGLAVVFCRARPGLPGFQPEHIHQYPYSEADRQRYEEFGWMVNATACIIPSEPFEEVDGDPAAKPLEVMDVTSQAAR